MTYSILRLPEVIQQTGLKRSTIYKMIGEGEFPRQVRLGPRSVGWDQSAIQSWIKQRLEGSGVTRTGEAA